MWYFSMTKCWQKNYELPWSQEWNSLVEHLKFVSQAKNFVGESSLCIFDVFKLWSISVENAISDGKVYFVVKTVVGANTKINNCVKLLSDQKDAMLPKDWKLWYTSFLFRSMRCCSREGSQTQFFPKHRMNCTYYNLLPPYSLRSQGIKNILNWTEQSGQFLAEISGGSTVFTTK